MSPCIGKQRKLPVIRAAHTPATSAICEPLAAVFRGCAVALPKLEIWSCTIAEPYPAEFKPISRAKVLTGKCWTTPVLSNGHIYCRNAVGDAVCLDVSGK